MGRLQGKTAIITGAASGIGFETARQFISQGARVLITDRNEEAGAQAAKELGKQALFFRQDVSQEHSWRALERFLTDQEIEPDIFVNNAGVLKNTKMQDLEKTELAEWKWVQSINVEGVFMGCQLAVKLMKEKGGAIVNIASVAANQATPELIAYGASKAAVAHITKSVANHCINKRYKIRCNSVHPNPIKTPMGDALMAQIGRGDTEKGWESFAANPAFGGIGQPVDVAQAVVFLASDEARHTTGTELKVDGGMSL